jgi:hypothetical protein
LARGLVSLWYFHKFNRVLKIKFVRNDTESNGLKRRCHCGNLVYAIPAVCDLAILTSA